MLIVVHRRHLVQNAHVTVTCWLTVRSQDGSAARTDALTDCVSVVTLKYYARISNSNISIIFTLEKSLIYLYTYLN